MMNVINRDPDAGVNIIYDEISDKFRIAANRQRWDNIRITQSGGNFFTQGETWCVGIDVEIPL